MTVLLKLYLGIDIYRSGFNLLSFWGLTITYCYFQIPLMILIIAPAIHGMRKEWNEAAATLGATNLQFWRYVGLPVLWPNLLGTLMHTPSTSRRVSVGAGQAMVVQDLVVPASACVSVW